MLMDSDKFALIGIKEDMRKLFDAIKEIADKANAEVRVGVTHLGKGDHYLEITATDYL